MACTERANIEAAAWHPELRRPGMRCKRLTWRRRLLRSLRLIPANSFCTGGAGWALPIDWALAHIALSSNKLGGGLRCCRTCMKQPGSCDGALLPESGHIMDSTLTHNATHQQPNHRQQINCTHGRRIQRRGSNGTTNPFYCNSTNKKAQHVLAYQAAGTQHPIRLVQMVAQE